jgi:hypothetical protein
MAPEGSLPCSQQPATGPYPEPDESSPHLPTLHTIHSNIIPSMTRSSKLYRPSAFSNQNNAYISHLSHPYYMHHPSSHSPDHPNNI